MGAWGVLGFDSDDAIDWAYGLDNVSDLSLVESAFDEVDAAADYLEAPIGCNALAACEVLARLLGKPGYQNSFTEKVDRWVLKHPAKPPAKLLTRASSTIDRILGDNSELRQLFEEGDASEWLEAVEDLRVRLRVSKGRKKPTTRAAATSKAKPFRGAEGDVIAIPLGDGMFGYGRVLASPLLGFYHLRSPQILDVAAVMAVPILFRVWGNGASDWTVIGNSPLEEALRIAPLFFKKDSISKKLSIYPGGHAKERPGTPEECEKLERAAVWSAPHIVDRLNDHFAGRKNKWYESLRP